MVCDYVTVDSLANVLLQGLDFSRGEGEGGSVGESEGKVPGLLQHMSHHHIRTLLAALHQSYSAAVEFDRRPGLKFLIQKVAQAERAANLYKQAGASWTLKMVTLFDLTLSQVKHGLGLEEVKGVLEQDVREKNTVKEESQQEQTITAKESDREEVKENGKKPLPRPKQLLAPDTMQYIQLLKDSFTELCDVYLDLVIDRDGHYSAMDKMDDQPIFFLTIQPDQFPTAHRKSLAEWTRSLEEFNKDYIKGKTNDSKTEAKDECNSLTGEVPVSEVGEAAEEIISPEEPQEAKEVRPFTFSDLARDYSSDSDDSEVPEFAEDDSGMSSLPGENFQCVMLVLFIFS